LYTAHEKHCHSALQLSVTKQMRFECSSKMSECNVRLGCIIYCHTGLCDIGHIRAFAVAGPMVWTLKNAARRSQEFWTLLWKC